MMNSDKLNALIKKRANGSNDMSLHLHQMFFFEHVLMRLEKSKYRDNIILKGGVLLSSIIGSDMRTTKDIDATLKSIALNEETIRNIFEEILSINIDDGVSFKIENIKDIREEEVYSGFRVNLFADFDGLKTNLLVDITTGDVITYREVNFKYNTIFDNGVIDILSYNYETIIAEKFEAIISRNIDNTRMKDYYDLYMFVNAKWSDIDKDLLKDAILNTSRNRGTVKYINDAYKYLDLVSSDEQLKILWDNYRKHYDYAKIFRLVRRLML